MRSAGYVTGMSNWLACLLENSAFTSSAHAVYSTCGTAPSDRVPLWMQISLQGYLGAVGVIPACVFGVLRDVDKERILRWLPTLHVMVASLTRSKPPVSEKMIDANYDEVCKQVELVTPATPATPVGPTTM
jgi:hypothetical protein